MLKEASTKIELLAINDKLYMYLKELHELKKYERETQKVMERNKRRQVVEQANRHAPAPIR